MHLCAAIFITCVPALATASGVPADTSGDVCEKMRLMPTTFVAKREFASLLNTIVFYDSFGEELGFVRSWLIDWANPFGYPGASFYVKAAPAPADGDKKAASVPADGGIWSVSSQHGEAGSAPLTHADLARQEEEMFDGDEQGEDYMHQTQLRHMRGKVAQNSSQTASLWTTFFCGKDHRMAASMTGSHVTEFKDELTIGDCKAQVFGKVEGGKIMMNSAAEAQYNTEQTSTENRLIIRDLGMPPIDLVRVDMKEASSPLMRFCAHMGMWNNGWNGQLMQPRYGQPVGNGIMNPSVIQIPDGVSTDMRFLALYSAYQFSNTRWSPLMSMIAWVLFAACLLGCIQRCCCQHQCGAWASKPVYHEEAESLMKINNAPVEKPEKPSMFACCSRKGGRSISLSN